MHTHADFSRLTNEELAQLRIKIRTRSDRGTFQADCIGIDGKRYQPTSKTRTGAIRKAFLKMGLIDTEEFAKRNMRKAQIANAGTYPRGSLMSGYLLACKDRWTSEQQTSERVKREALTIVDYFGRGLQLEELTYELMSEYVTHLKEDVLLSNASINRRLSKLSVIVKMCAVQLGYRNTDQRLLFTKLTEASGRDRWFSLEEEAMMIQWMEDHNLKDFAEFIRVDIDTGARCGELFKLEWKDVDLVKAEVVLTTRKTKGGKLKKRVVPLTKACCEVFTARRARGLDAPFGNITQHQLSHYWKRMRFALGYGNDLEFVPHVMRHTCASRLAMQGTPAQTIALWLGHSTLEMVQRYVKLHACVLASTRDRLEEYNTH